MILNFYSEYARLEKSASCHKSLQLKKEIASFKTKTMSDPKL